MGDLLMRRGISQIFRRNPGEFLDAAGESRALRERHESVEVIPRISPSSQNDEALVVHHATSDDVAMLWGCPRSLAVDDENGEVEQGASDP